MSEVGVIASVEKQTGQCTLSPTWQEVTGLHYCSQFSPKEAGIVGVFWRRMHENRKREDDERKRRIETEKKLKEAREKLKEARNSDLEKERT